jgi:hypothetical protein
MGEHFFPLIFFTKQWTKSQHLRPLYMKGCAIGYGFSVLIVAASLALHVGLTRENTKRDRIHGVVDPDTLLDVSELGDAHPGFRYVTWNLVD